MALPSRAKTAQQQPSLCVPGARSARPRLGSMARYKIVADWGGETLDPPRARNATMTAGILLMALGGCVKFDMLLVVAPDATRR